MLVSLFRASYRVRSMVSLLLTKAVVIIMLSTSNLHAQCVRFVSKLLHDTVGNTVRIPLRINVANISADTTTIRIRVMLSNASMMYPLRWRGSEADTVDLGIIDRIRAGVFTLQRRFDVRSGTTELPTSLEAIATAGSDTVCTMVVWTMVSDSASCTADTLTLYLRNVNHSSSYVRLLSVDATIPLPCEGCSRLRWRYHSEYDDSVRAEIFDITGRLIDVFTAPISAGEGDILYDPSRQFLYNGLYAIRFRSTTGSAIQWFVLGD